MVLVFSTNATAQRTCMTCNGNGKVKIPGVRRFTIGNTRQERLCQVCYEKYNPEYDHWHTCPSCKGSRVYGSNKTNNNNTTNDNNNIYQYLDPSERAALDNLLKVRMKGTKIEQRTCGICNGNRICKACKGTLVIFGNQPCSLCLMSGNCHECRGRGVVNKEVPMSQQELQQLDDKIKMFTNIGLQRMK